MSHHYIAGPWEWDDSAGAVSAYRAPAGCTALVDLRTIPQQSAPQHTSGVGNGFFCLPDDQPVPSGYTLLGTGDLREVTTNQQSRSAWQSMFGVTPQGDYLVDYLAWTLTDGSDPEGDTAPKPLDLCPETGDILLAGHSVVWSSPLDVRGSNARWALMLRDRIRKDLQRLAETDGDDLWRKNLATIKWKYSRQRWNDPDGEEIWLTPQMRGRGKRGATYAIEPATTYTESWPTDGAITSGQDRSWSYLTAYSSSLTVTSGKLRPNSGSSQTCRPRMGSALSGTDVYASCVHTALTSGANSQQAGTMIRKDSNDGTATYYEMYALCYASNSLTDQLYKCVTGSLTSIGGGSGWTFAANDVLKAEANGSALKFYRNGSSIASVTDTAITTGTYCGMKTYGRVTDIYLETDNWECGDLGGGGAAKPVLFHAHYLNQGMR